MIITKEYINKHKTAKGSWTRDQIVSLGIKWPPESGWMAKAIGSEITNENKHRFESAAYAKGDKKIRLSPNALAITDTDVLIELRDRIQCELNKRGG